jgi:(5-formylfuran-3-yl)methyl phosphate synthase
VKRYALSLKQPWATLLAHGLKTIEVRSWPTDRRGKILIHAARVPDHRTEAWAKLPLELHSAARQVGGIIGEGDLVNCVEYSTPDEFAADRESHLNDAAWFEPPRLYGFKFADLKPLPFRPYSGWMRFFPVEVANESSSDGSRKREAAAQVVNSAAHGWDLSNAGRCVRLLVSVRSAEEALAALDGGADIIDIKEPSRGSLGRSDDKTIAAILDAVAGRCLTSAACGELLENPPIPRDGRLAFVKWGLADCGRLGDWPSRLEHAAASLPADCRPVAVAYADWQRAKAPNLEAVSRSVCVLRKGALLIDTWQKAGKSLLDFLSIQEIEMVMQRCRIAQIPIALAGALDRSAMKKLLPLRPAIIGVRSAACREGNRNREIDKDRVRRLSALLTQDLGERRHRHLSGHG